MLCHSRGFTFAEGLGCEESVQVRGRIVQLDPMGLHFRGAKLKGTAPIFAICLNVARSFRQGRS
jgi:hypothetical protein